MAASPSLLPLYHLVERILEEAVLMETPREATVARVAAAYARADGDYALAAKHLDTARDFVKTAPRPSWQDILRAETDCAEAKLAAGNTTGALADLKAVEKILLGHFTGQAEGAKALTGMIAVLERVQTGCCGCGGCTKDIVEATRTNR